VLITLPAFADGLPLPPRALPSPCGPIIAGIHNPCRGPPPAIYPPAPRYYPSLFPGPFYGHPFYYAVPPPPFPFVVPLP
jgi:hypothetical protein